jgi:hypothetical protein
MGKIRANAAGEIVQLLREDEVGFRIAPPDTVYEIDFDDEANPQIFDGIARDFNEYELRNETLSYLGAAVTINPPSAEKQRLIDARAANATLLDAGDYAESDALTQGLATKVAWLELEVTRLLRVLEG